MKSKRYLSFLLSFIIVSVAVLGQDAGDEDTRMFNDPRETDKAAIEEALNGWWKASMKNHEERIGWWRDARFGMFIHWGVYSVPGGEWNGKEVTGYAEHLMRKEKIPVNEYREKVVKPFNPVMFNADEWILTAKKAGMKYFVITAKHHDGVAIFDSEVSDLDVTDGSVFGRDPMAELAEACRRHGMKFGFYYSHAFDWEHPDAPGNDWDYQNPGGDLNLFGGRDWFFAHPELIPKAVKYVNEKSIPQIRELINKYKPDLLWFDTPHKLPFFENLKILEEIRKADPNVVVNGRLARTGSLNFGDYLNTADRPQEFFPVEEGKDWEAIPTTNESYGYSRYDNSHKPASFFIQLLAKSASRGGNLLMNIGPKGDGAFDERDLEILNEIGAWMEDHGESIYGTSKSPLPLQSWGVVTKKEKRLYLHVFKWPEDGRINVGGLQTLPLTAQVMNGAGTNLKTKLINKGNDLAVFAPLSAPDNANSVIILQFNEPVKTGNVRLLQTSETQTLLAFDAKINGEGMSYGDGKADRYYVQNWKSLTQSVEWEFRTAEKTRFEVLIKYAGGKGYCGTYRIVSGNQEVKGQVNSGEAGIKTISLGEMEFLPGRHTLTIAPVEICGEQLMQLFQVDLKPLKTNLMKK